LKLFDRIAVSVVLSGLAHRCIEDRIMFPAAARFAGAFVLLALAIASTRADDDDPEYEGVKVSEWIRLAQKGESARQRALAVEALGKIWGMQKSKVELIPPIGSVLTTDPSAAVRAQAALVLARMRTEDRKMVAPYLLAALRSEKESRVRKEIILAMVKFPDVCVEGLEQLTAVLKDPDAAVKIAAAEAIVIAAANSKMKDDVKGAAPGLVPLLKDDNKSVRLAGVFALGRIQPEGASTLSETMAKMLSTEKDADIKRELVTSIGLLGEKTEVAAKALGVALSDADDEVRRRAARVLGTFGPAAKPVVDELFKVVTTEKVTDIRVDAVRAFGSALGPVGVKARLKDLRSQLDPTVQPAFEVRLALVDEIGALGWEHLGIDLMSPDKAVKEEAQITIVALRKRLADPQFNVREAAARAIRTIEKKPEPKKEPDKKEPEKKDP
jgi:HEAT repeat protein